MKAGYTLLSGHSELTLISLPDLSSNAFIIFYF
ncbi:hypothetical protein WLH_03959 [Escherichia coli O25b:H4]|uniref:Uncharacterized protein n=1 Tax=Escherichia coli O25b:H4 TaxID=941280 RepID=A0A192CH30_ECO25|nr:hypothetical protein WLH_03959 [Escherichia coli O25b:H4]KGM72412.1 hypothetical protein EL78_3553 [Escherichia coli]